MTDPTSGFPDWQQYASWRGQTLLSSIVSPGAGGTTTAVTASVGNYASLRIILEGQANGVEVQMFGGDSAISPNQWLINRWIVRTNTVIRTVIPVLTSWVQIVVVSQAGLAGSVFIHVQPTNVASDKLHYFGHQNILNVENRAIAAAVTDFWYPAVLFGGPAHLWAITVPASVDLLFQVETYNSDGTILERIARWRLFAAEFNTDFQLPSKSWRISVLNVTAGAQNYYFTITPQGMLT